MDEIRPHEQIELNNFTAQKASLLAELNVIAADLTNNHVANDAAKATLETILKQIEDARTEHESITRESSDKKSEAERLLASANSLDEKTKTESASFGSYREEELKKIEDLKVTLDAELAEKRAEAKALEEKNTTATTTLNDTLAQVVAATHSLEAAQTNKTAAESAHDLDRKQHEIDMDLMAKEIIATQEMIVTIKAEQATEAAKTSGIRDILDAREKELSQREENLTIRLIRFRDVYQELYPGIEPKI